MANMDFLSTLSIGGTYLQSEGDLTSDEKKVVSALQAQLTKDSWDTVKKNKVIGLLNQIEDLARENRSVAQQQITQLTESEDIINKEIKALEENNTILKDLQLEKINANVQDICNSEYAEYYTQITEYNYRLAIVTQQKEVVKENLLKYDKDIETIQMYVKALQS